MVHVILFLKDTHQIVEHAIKSFKKSCMLRQTYAYFLINPSLKGLIPSDQSSTRLYVSLKEVGYALRRVCHLVVQKLHMLKLAPWLFKDVQRKLKGNALVGSVAVEDRYS